MKQQQVKNGRVAGILFTSNDKSTLPTLVLFNQWRSGAKSLFSKYLAEMAVGEGVYGSVLFLDRIASGGMSDNHLSKHEKQRMKHQGDFQFAKLYADAIASICKSLKLEAFSIGGSSAGACAALAAASELPRASKVVLVEPSGLRSHGSFSALAVPVAFARHAIAYRHRISRGWWTPMDKEQYFAKGSMFESRAQYWSTDKFKEQLKAYADNPSLPKLSLVLSADSHIHTKENRHELNNVIKKPHELVFINGNHDKICQPPHLSKLYS